MRFSLFDFFCRPRAFNRGRDFTVDYDIRNRYATIIPHSKAAKAWMKDMVDAGILRGPSIPERQVVEVVQWMRREGFMVN